MFRTILSWIFIIISIIYFFLQHYTLIITNEFQNNLIIFIVSIFMTILTIIGSIFTGKTLAFIKHDEEVAETFRKKGSFINFIGIMVYLPLIIIFIFMFMFILFQTFFMNTASFFVFSMLGNIQKNTISLFFIFLLILGSYYVIKNRIDVKYTNIFLSKTGKTYSSIIEKSQNQFKKASDSIRNPADTRNTIKNKLKDQSVKNIKKIKPPFHF
ncbi:hypothetical protein B6U98_04915 [Thermoplasmatales archaeon ex4572_165]|nr:MAG: hypothetical protein B6U98_04915 [Thermoplasmatales archaeon ex4572_165]RLF59962.1 MAG: hypothetical protein DRN27_01085 [Thermoplasmata archaeon]